MEYIKSKYIIIGSIIIVLIFGFYMFNSLRLINKISVNVAAIPKDSKLYINNEEVSRGNQSIYPGTYNFKATYEGYEDDTYTIFIEEDTDIRLLPSPVSTEAIKKNNNPETQAARENFGGIKAVTIGKNNREQNDIINKLPVDMFNYKSRTGPFSIDYGPSPDDINRFFLLVNNSSPNGRINATNWIRDQGVKTSELEVLFSDFANPLLGTD